jgi:hypothetical protein
MTAKIITSTVFGLLLPWLYFFITDTHSMNLYHSGVLIKEATQASEVELFIEFHGWQQSLIYYLKSFLACFFVAFAICSANNLIAKRLKTKNL